MAEYVGINSEGLAVSGIWNSDSIISEEQTLVELTGEATIGWTYIDGEWVAPLISISDVRAKRDGLLRESDFTQLPDVGDNDARSSWATYRQELRDMPSTYTPIANPTYPTKP